MLACRMGQVSWLWLSASRDLRKSDLHCLALRGIMGSSWDLFVFERCIVIVTTSVYMEITECYKPNMEYHFKFK